MNQKGMVVPAEQVEKWKGLGYSEEDMLGGFVVIWYDSWGNYIDEYYETSSYEDALCCLECWPTLRLEIYPAGGKGCRRMAVSA